MSHLGSFREPHPLVRSRRWVPIAIGAYAIAFAWLVTAIPVPAETTGTVSALTSATAIWIAAATIGLQVRRRGLPAQDGGWLLIACALFAFGFGELAWTVQSATGEPSVPSVAELGYVAFIPLMFAGILRVFRPNRLRTQVELLLDAAAAGLVVTAVVWTLVLEPVLGDSGLTTPEKAFLALYPASDLLLLMAVLVGYLGRSRIPGRPAAVLAGGLLSFLVADLAFAYTSLETSYRTGQLSDLGWSLGALLIASACALAGGRDQVVREAGARSRGSVVLLAIPLAGLVLADDLLGRSSGSPSVIEAILSPEAMATVRDHLAAWAMVIIAGVIGVVRVGYLVRARSASAAAAERMAAELAQREVVLEEQNRQLQERNRALEEVDRLKDELIAAAEEASRAKSEFLAAMSHEVRTPLHGILGSIELLRGSVTDDTGNAQLDLLERSAVRQLHIVDEVLDFSRVEARRMELEASPVDLVALVREVAELARPAATARGLALTVEVADGVPACLRGDGVRLSQVVSNLVGNAITVTDAGRVVVALAPLDPATDPSRATVQLSVIDTGPGLALDLQERIFTPFFQVDGTTARRHGGAGLGLTIVRRLVELMGGRIWVVSAPGEGAAFHVALPLAPVAASVQVPGTGVPDGHGEPEPERGNLRVFRAPAGPPGCATDRILVVEDDPVGARIATAILARLGRQAVVAEDGPAALRALEAQPFAMVLMDLQLPGMDGVAVTRELRRREAASGQPPVPVVAASADAYESARQACEAAGMDGHLSKPYRASDLRQAMELWAPAVPEPAPAG